MRPLLEGDGQFLSASGHMSTLYIPLTEQREIKRVVQELLHLQFFSLIFDGTTRLGEAISFVTRMVTDTVEI